MIKFNIMGIISSKKGGNHFWKGGGNRPPVPPPPKSALEWNRQGSLERCSYKIFNCQAGDSCRIRCILHVLNVRCALLQLYMYICSHYGVINEQSYAAAPAAWVRDDGCSMLRLPRHEYGTMGAACRGSRVMSTGRWVQYAAAPAVMSTGRWVQYAAAPASWVRDDGCSMPRLPRHEYGTMGAACRGSRVMSTGRWVQYAAAPAAWVTKRLNYHYRHRFWINTLLLLLISPGDVFYCSCPVCVDDNTVNPWSDITRCSRRPQVLRRAWLE